MKNLRHLISCGLLAGIATPPALAANTPPAKTWSDEAELSYVETSGNSEVKTLSARNLLKIRFPDSFTGSWKLAALRGESDGALTAAHYLTELRLDYLINDRVYAFGALAWSKDEFAGIDSNTTIGPGLGYRFLTGPRHLLAGEAGVLYVRERYSNSARSDRFDSRLFGTYTYAFSDKNRFVQTLEYLRDFEDSGNYRFNSETALVTSLTGRFSVKVSYHIRYDHQPVPDTLEQTDTTFATALIATF